MRYRALDLKEKRDQCSCCTVDLRGWSPCVGPDVQPCLAATLELTHLLKVEPMQFRVNMGRAILPNRLFRQKSEVIVVATGRPGGEDDGQPERVKVLSLRKGYIFMLRLADWPQQDVLDQMDSLALDIEMNQELA